MGGQTTKWRATASAAVLMAGVLAVAVPAGASAQPLPEPAPGTANRRVMPPLPGPLLSVGQRVAALSRQIDEAGARAEAARAAADSQRSRLGELQGRQAELRGWIDAMSLEIGQLASLQYRSGGVSPKADLILHGGSTEYLHRSAVYDRIAAGRVDLEKTYTARHRELDAVVADAARTAGELATREAAADGELAAVRAASAEATRLLTGLDVAGMLANPGNDPGPGGRTALQFAITQIGRPYVWGATGPDAYDCSGLTSRAWQSAGAAVPRTSQEQWAQLPRVPLAELRPGDLVVYFPDATHIGMYLGAGIMVHAPRPGRHVTTAKLDSLPILGAVRPVAPQPA